MFAEERQEKIYDLICERQTIKVSELSKIFETSKVTIRRDLDVLQRQNRILRTHGGAMPAYNVGLALISRELVTTHVEEKRSIARFAYQFINDNDTLLMDSSSTVLELARLLIAQPKNSLRVVTTSLDVVRLLSDQEGYTLILVGGDYNTQHQTVEGYLACHFIENLRVDKCFIGINGIEERFGLSTPRFADAQIKSKMIASSAESFVLADSSKFGRVYLAKVDACSCILTDTRSDRFNYDAMDEDSVLMVANEENRGRA